MEEFSLDKPKTCFNNNLLLWTDKIGNACNKLYYSQKELQEIWTLGMLVVMAPISLHQRVNHIKLGEIKAPKVAVSHISRRIIVIWIISKQDKSLYIMQNYLIPMNSMLKKLLYSKKMKLLGVFKILFLIDINKARKLAISIDNLRLVKIQDFPSMIIVLQILNFRAEVKQYSQK